MNATSGSADARGRSDILVVDDDEDVMWLITTLLGEAGHDVRPASDGALALVAAHAAPPGLILLDIKLPGLDGFEVCRRLKADPLTAGVPVIFLSALQDDSEKGRAFRSGGVDYITKPIHREELLARVGTHLAIVRTQRDLEDARDAAQTAMRAEQKERLEREQLQASLTQADRLASLGMLAAGVAHEINNPLSYVLYDLETLTEDLPKLATVTTRCRADLRAVPADAPTAALAGLLDPTWLDDVLSRTSEALDGVRRIRDVVKGLGTFSRVERANLGDVDVAAALDSAVGMAINEIKYRAVLVKNLAQVPPVRASEGKLVQVFLNLLVNAAHAIDEGNVRGNRITVRTWADADEVYAEVADTGAGIPAESLERVFEPFFTSKGVGKGSALGLPIGRNLVTEFGGERPLESTGGEGTRAQARAASICRNLIAEFGGELHLESAVGKGTRAIVRLPRAQARSVVPPPAKRPEAAMAAFVRGRLLVVDDEPAIRSAMGRLLGTAHTVVTAASGAEARSILEHDAAFDVILCDLMMPDMTGMELHAWMVRFDPSLAAKVVFVTGGAFTPQSSEYVARTGNTRIEKPFDAAALKTLVAELVAANQRPMDPLLSPPSQPTKFGVRH